MQSISSLLSLAVSYEQELPAPAPIQIPVGAALAALIDHTLLKPDASSAQIENLCKEARQHLFASVCVNPTHVAQCSRWLAGSPVKVCSVVGFPLGATLTPVKVNETLECIQLGASEIDMVINIGALKDQNYTLALADIQAVVQAAHQNGAIVKVIIETALLTRQEKIIACLLCRQAQADFVKTSTGFAAAGATPEDVNLMWRVVGPQMQVKAAGGVRTYADALAMIQAGAGRIGASAGVQILRQAEEAAR